MFGVRLFSEKDAVVVSAIAREAFRDEAERGMPNLEPQMFLSFVKRPGARVLVTEEADEITGFLSLTEGDIEKPAQIHLAAVKDDRRGKGIGRALVKAAIEHVRSTGRKKLKLFTRPWNTAMIKVCEDLGFTREAYLRRDYLNEDIVLYSLFLE